MDDNNRSEELPSHQNSAEVIDHTCDDRGEKITRYGRRSRFEIN